jgi:phospholipase/carboxylesterase
MPADAPIVVDTGPNPTTSVIWLHGLGADGYDFEGIVPQLGLPASAAIRFVFPHAPEQPVTINAGMHMPAWYDIHGPIGGGHPEDEAGMRVSQGYLEALVAREIDRGIDPERIVLAGFSQGGAVALFTALRHPQRLAGVMALSTYLPLTGLLAAEASPANRGLPVFMAHGRDDAIVPLAAAQSSRDVLTGHGCAVDWHTYPMAHSLCGPELVDIRAWLVRVLGL